MIPCNLSGMNFPTASPSDPPSNTASELKTVPPAGIFLKISFMMITSLLKIFTRDRI